MTAADGFAAYYTAKLWHLIPEVYRTGEGYAPSEGPSPHGAATLRALVVAMGQQFAAARRRSDRLWEDAYIDSCADWAVPLIGALLATRMVPSLGLRGRRVDVAQTIHYRRRRGTPFVIEALVRELTGWDVALVEAYRRLARFPHRLNAPLHLAPAGRLSTTPRGGCANLRHTLAATLTGTPFSEFAHTADFRRLRGVHGRYGIHKLNLHLYRLRVYEVENTDPIRMTDAGPVTWLIDPSGRDIALFARGVAQRRPRVALKLRGAGAGAAAASPCRPLHAWEVRAPISCRVLGHSEYRLSLQHVHTLLALPPASRPTAVQQQALLALVGHRFGSGATLARALAHHGVLNPASAAEPPWYRTMLTLALVPACGLATLYPRPQSFLPSPNSAYSVHLSLAGAPEACDQAHLTAAHLGSRACHPTPADGAVRTLLYPEQGRFAFVSPQPTDAPRVRLYHYAFSADVGAGTYHRTTLVAPAGVHTGGGAIPSLPSGLTTIGDSRTYALTVAATPRTTTTLQALTQQRPYVRCGVDATTGGAVFVPSAAAPQSLTIDGLWLGSSTTSPSDIVLAASGAAPGNFDWDVVRIRHCTFDPGGIRADGVPIAPLRLLIAGRVRRLIIERSIMGAVEVLRHPTGADGFIEKVRIRDSIIDGQRAATGVGILSCDGAVDLARVTVFGHIRVEQLHATDTVVLGEVLVTAQQRGCFRFSAAHAGAGFPRRFRSWPPAPLGPTGPRLSPAFFSSLRFGDATYAQLSPAAPRAIAQGAENGAEMGVFNSNMAALRLAGVRTKVDEYAPSSVYPQFPIET